MCQNFGFCGQLKLGGKKHPVVVYMIQSFFMKFRGLTSMEYDNTGTILDQK